MKKLATTFSLPVFVLLMNTPQAVAQRATASVAGDVLDPSRAPVPGARVVVRISPQGQSEPRSPMKPVTTQ